MRVTVPTVHNENRARKRTSCNHSPPPSHRPVHMRTHDRNTARRQSCTRSRARAATMRVTVPAMHNENRARRRTDCSRSPPPSHRPAHMRTHDRNTTRAHTIATKSARVSAPSTPCQPYLRSRGWHTPYRAVARERCVRYRHCATVGINSTTLCEQSTPSVVRKISSQSRNNACDRPSHAQREQSTQTY